MSDNTNEPAGRLDLLVLTAEIVSAHVSNNSIATADVPSLIQQVFSTLSGLGSVAVAEPIAELTPAVAIRKSVTPDYIICLEDGKKLKMLKRHIRNSYNMTPEQYRARWNLPASYPMVAPAYAARRRDLALQIGLGKKAGTKAAKPVGRPKKIAT